MNIFKAIGSGIKVAAVWIADQFIRLFGKDASEQFAKSALAILKSDFGKIVLTIVETVATTNLSNDEKRSEAFAQIKSSAEVNGIDAKDSVINLLIELAVSTLKQNFGEAA